MLTEADVQQAVEFESHDAPVLSVYLNVDTQQRSAEKYKIAMRNLLDQAGKADLADIQRVQNYVEMGYNRQGRSVVMFSCAKKEFWWAQSLQVPVDDFAFVSFRPYVRQLASLLEIYQRYGVVHVDSAGARLYIFNMGVLEGAEGYLGEEIKVHRAGGWAAQRYQRKEVEQARQNLQVAAEVAEGFYRSADTRHLILAGTDKNVARFQELLSNRLRSLIVGHFAADANATPGELQGKALELAQKAGRASAGQTADDVLALSKQGGNAVLGLSETLTAVQQGRAQHVVVINSFAQPAYRFVDSGAILLTLTEEADLASGRVMSLPDAVESVLRRAMAQNIGVTLVDKHAGLEKAGKIGALTRY
jgi:peptide subunit release factor 1 (eRF1)